MTSGRSSIGVAVLTACLVFVLAGASDMVLEQAQPTSFWPYLIDDVVMSVIAGSLVWFYERRRLREIAKKLYVIAEMNHRVRNELEVIQYSAYATKEKPHIATISESVSRIEAALREILERRKSKPADRHPGADP